MQGVPTKTTRRVGAAARRAATAYVRAGTKRDKPSDRRAHEIVNFISLAAVASSMVIAVALALIDLSLFGPLVLALLGFSFLWTITPFLHRYGTLAAGTYLWATAMIGDAVYAMIVGRAAGMHYFLLAAPAIIVMALGSRRLLLVAFYFSMLLAAFVAIEVFVPEHTALVPLSDTATRMMFIAAVCSSAVFNLLAALYTFRRAEAYQRAFEVEHERSESLLHSLLPATIADRLIGGEEGIIADDLPAVTILFCDIAGFTARASRLPAGRLVAYLNRVFLAFDRLAEEHGLEKIKTIGDAYMVAGGMPQPRDDHAAAVAHLALDMLAAVGDLSRELGEEVSVRIGIHTGPAVAGVIGERKQFYDVWGDTVNVAARMEQHGDIGLIQVSPEARAAIGDGFAFRSRGLVDVKGKGPMELFELVGRLGDANPAEALSPSVAVA